MVLSAPLMGSPNMPVLYLSNYERTNNLSSVSILAHIYSPPMREEVADEQLMELYRDGDAGAF